MWINGVGERISAQTVWPKLACAELDGVVFALLDTSLYESCRINGCKLSLEISLFACTVVLCDRFG